jgi:hypothetical protein
MAKKRGDPKKRDVDYTWCVVFAVLTALVAYLASGTSSSDPVPVLTPVTHSKKPRAVPAGKSGTQGNPFWLNAQKRLADNSDALNLQPDIYAIPHFLNESACDHLVKLFDERKLEAAMQKEKYTRYCFEKEIGMPEKATAEHSAVFETDKLLGDDCTRNVGAGRALAKAFSGVHSTSVMIAQGEDRLIDWLSTHLEQTVAFDPDFAFHTQLLEYENDQSYNAHTDCSGGEDDRSSTVLIYLSGMPNGSGGETEFTELGLKVSYRLECSHQPGSTRSSN